MIKSIRVLLGLFLMASSAIAQINNSLQVETYQLPNGFTVFLNQDTTATRVFGAVMVNAGSKHEDPNATGMAHYLEHLLFKGTEEYGTSNFQAEKVHLDSINLLYEELAKTTDEDQRKAIQKSINDQALKASKYGMPNEFDKMLKSIGSTGINAFTSEEMTFYHNSFPGHEVEKWLTLYADRFKNPVFRSFQSELEVVYEEKNRAMDDFENRVFTVMEENLFPNLPYGQWPVLGTVEHLKTPSLIRMYQFYEENYVSNNMALILSGNFDPEVVKPIIAKQYTKIPEGKAKELNLPEMERFTKESVVKKRMTPVKAGFIGFQTCDQSSEDRIALNVAEYLLSNNSETGLINQLMTNNEVIYSGAFSMVFNDAGGFVMYYVPKIVGQSLNKAEGLVEAQLEKVRSGNFSDDVFLAAKNDLITEFKLSLENVTRRGIMIGESFNRGVEWEEFIKYPELVDQVSKEDVMKMANKYFGEGRVKVISRTGFPKKTKLDKPDYKPIVTEQKEESDYYKIFSKLNSLDFKPRYLDFDEDVQRKELPGGHELIVSNNPINDLFTLDIQFKIGRKDDPRLIETSGFAYYFGAGEKEVGELKEKFAALGVDYNFRTKYSRFAFNIRGRENKLPEVLELVNELFTNPRADEKTKEIFLNSTIADRKLQKKSPSTMGRALYFYGVLDQESEYLSRLDEKELKQISTESIVNKYKDITSNYQTEIHFAGTTAINELSSLINNKLSLSENGKATDLSYQAPKAPTKNKILFVNDKKAIQSIVYFHVQGNPADKDEFVSRSAFQQYFGGGFSGLVLQEIREYRSLAYSAAGGFYVPDYPEGTGRLWGFIGCQADKTVDAIPVMVDLITNLPEKPERIEALRNNLQLKTITDFPEFKELPSAISALENQGYETDPNLEAFNAYSELEMQDIVKFYENNVKGRPYLITIYGDKKRIDLDELKKYGEIEELDLEDVIKF